MRRIRIVIAIITLACATAAPSAAQTITVYDDSDPRASVRIGSGGNGFDWEASIDSPVLANFIRVRAGVGQGRWDSAFDSYRDPTVTRLAASALVFLPSRPEIKPYVGLGIARYLPRGGGLTAQTGQHLIAGMEGSGERWTIGVELEFDFPSKKAFDRPLVEDELFPTGRIGLAIRRAF